MTAVVIFVSLLHKCTLEMFVFSLSRGDLLYQH